MIAEFHARQLDPDRADPDRRVLLTVPQPFGNHNGGMLAFGPDGYLYIGLGDGGSAGDPGNRAQNPTSCSARSCASTSTAQSPTRSRRTTRSPPAAGARRSTPSACAIPGASPSTATDGRLLAGDVGQNAVRGDRRHRPRRQLRLADHGGPPLLPADRPAAAGRDCCRRSPTTGTSKAAARSSAATSIAVPRCRSWPAPICSATTAAARSSACARARSVLLDTDLQIASFGEDEAGEVYVVDLAVRLPDRWCRPLIPGRSGNGRGEAVGQDPLRERAELSGLGDAGVDEAGRAGREHVPEPTGRAARQRARPGSGPSASRSPARCDRCGSR